MNCADPGAYGPCVARVDDGRCLWCHRQLRTAVGPVKVRDRFDHTEAMCYRAG